MTKEDTVQKWRASAQEDLEVAKELFAGKRYPHCLFFCQLSLEKLLKREITTFNIEARYDIHKERLYKKATGDFTRQYLSRSEELFLWIRNALP